MMFLTGLLVYFAWVGYLLGSIEGQFEDSWKVHTFLLGLSLCLMFFGGIQPVE